MDQQQTPLVCPSHTTQYIGAVIVGILIGAGASFVYLNKPAGGDRYQEGFEAAKKRVMESPMGGMFRGPDTMLAIPGTVTAVNGNRITIHTQTMNPFEDPALDDRTVVITADTKISKLSQKDPKTLQAEMDAYMKKMQPGKVPTQPVTPPEPFTRTPATAQDIKSGDIVNATSGTNIKTAKEFTATEIQIQPSAPMPTTAPSVPVAK